MDVLLNVVNYILGFGSAVFVPLIMLIIGLCFRMKFSDAFVAALTLGVAFTGMSMLIDFMTGAVTPAAQGLADKTGIVLTSVDVGWPSASAITWAWPYIVLMFVLVVVLNIIMLALKLTDTLNVDLWNVWGKGFTAVMVYYVCREVGGYSEMMCVVLAFVAAAIHIVLELKVADMWQPSVQKITGIPGVTTTHCLTLIAVPMYPFERLLDKIPALRDNALDAKWLRGKIGIFAENAVMGFIIGVVLGAVAYADIQQALTLGVQAGTAMQLFPMVSKLFMQALSPISDAVSNVMKKRFKGRELHIGLDWPILAGSNELWVCCILLVPVELIFAFILAPAGNTVLPFAGIINNGLACALMLLTGANLAKMMILGIICVPIYLFSATYFAPYMTSLAREFSPDALASAGNSMISWSSIELPEFRWAVATAFSGENLLGWVYLVVFIALFVLLLRHFKKKNEEIKKELGIE